MLVCNFCEKKLKIWTLPVFPLGLHVLFKMSLSPARPSLFCLCPSLLCLFFCLYPSLMCLDFCLCPSLMYLLFCRLTISSSLLVTQVSRFWLVKTTLFIYISMIANERRLWQINSFT